MNESQSPQAVVAWYETVRVDAGAVTPHVVSPEEVAAICDRWEVDPATFGASMVAAAPAPAR